ncbi:PAAR domain-containing protein [Pandoraea sp.]|uniref:PAAR domain-containing protein n=1 Tax=Pandoraea sp. TaxID=1883445 RepID=UPI0035B3B7D3
MRLRPYICNGDQTDVGGRVETPNRKDTLNGRIAAYEDDPVWCPECKSYGRIGCTGYRLHELGAGGKRPALADDVCLCKCRRHPVLVPSQTTSCSGA